MARCIYCFDMHISNEVRGFVKGKKKEKRKRKKETFFVFRKNSVHVNDSLHWLNVQQSAGDISVDKRSCSPGFTSHCAMPKQMQSATIHLWTDIVENPKVLSI